jgi:hypothetical protein
MEIRYLHAYNALPSADADVVMLLNLLLRFRHFIGWYLNPI